MLAPVAGVHGHITMHETIMRVLRTESSMPRVVRRHGFLERWHRATDDRAGGDVTRCFCHPTILSRRRSRAQCREICQSDRDVA
jgi:hypothetical protein